MSVREKILDEIDRRLRLATEGMNSFPDHKSEGHIRWREAAAELYALKSWIRLHTKEDHRQ